MKVLILTEGSRKIGFGHVTRCLSLYQAFREKMITPEFLINGDESIRGLLKNTEYKLFNWICEKNKILEMAKSADIAIIDSYIADSSFYKRISDIVRIPVYIDDTKRLDYPRGILINGSIYAKRIKYPPKKDISYFLGTSYMPLRRAFWGVPQKTVRKTVKNIIISFGGEDTKNMTPKILGLLNKDHPRVIKNLIIGSGFKNIGQIEKLKTKEANMIYRPDAAMIRRLMLDADLAISAGGQTLYELARIGVPAVVVAVAKNQMGNIHGWQKAGFIEYAGWWRDKNMLSRVSRGIDALSAYENRLRRKRTGNSFVDGKGAERIANMLSRCVRICS